MANTDYGSNQSHGTAERTSMLKRGQVRVEVSPERIDGQHRHLIERVRRQQQDALKLGDLDVEYFTVKAAVFDIRDQITEAQAELGEVLETEALLVGGYVLNDAPWIANLRADRPLDALLKTLVHESRHVWQLTTSIGQIVSPDRQEQDAQQYTEQRWPRLIEELGRR